MSYWRIAVPGFDVLATSLEGFAYYADKFRARLGELAEFDAAFIDEALVVANRLREQSAIKLSSTAVARQAQQLAFRNRLITLLNERADEVVAQLYSDYCRSAGVR